jgi:hypothetical protein
MGTVLVAAMLQGFVKDEDIACGRSLGDNSAPIPYF